MCTPAAQRYKNIRDHTVNHGDGFEPHDVHKFIQTHGSTEWAGGPAFGENAMCHLLCFGLLGLVDVNVKRAKQGCDTLLGDNDDHREDRVVAFENAAAFLQCFGVCSNGVCIFIWECAGRVLCTLPYIILINGMSAIEPGWMT